MPKTKKTNVEAPVESDLKLPAVEVPSKSEKTTIEMIVSAGTLSDLEKVTAGLTPKEVRYFWRDIRRKEKEIRGE